MCDLSGKGAEKPRDTSVPTASTGFIAELIGDGRPLISFTGICLALSGGFALFQSGTGHFLPHDTQFLRMTTQELCGFNECRIVHFMIHDRVSFGGALVAIAVMYLWLAAFPLRAGQAWSWWTLVISGVVGFGSFLTYLGYGYLDTWHGAATLVLLPCYVMGLWKSWALILKPSESEANPFGPQGQLVTLLQAARGTRQGLGRLCLLLTAIGMIGAGFTIQFIGMTSVFVATDLTFIGLDRDQLQLINPRLIPLIAHDRAGFGGAVATSGILLFLCVWFNTTTRALWQAMLIAGIAGWSTAIGIHPMIGYTDAGHLAPAMTGAILFFGGMVLARPRLEQGA